MNNLNLLPGYTFNEYLLVLNPHEELRNKIQAVKKQFAQEFQLKAAFSGSPQLALVSFKQYAMVEERIVNRLHAIAMAYPAIKIELKDYGSFPTHTIFINVASKFPVQGLVKKIRTEAQRILKCDAEHKPHFMLDPFIPVARKLQPWQYEKDWQQYKHRHFTGRFIADGMMLLKRKPGEHNYQVLQYFNFENLPINTTQTSLF